MCPLFCQKKVKGKTKQNTHYFWKAGVGFCADVSSPARDLTWSSGFRCVHELWLHVGNSPFPHTAHGAGIIKLAIPRCAPVSFASGCSLYCLDYLHFHSSWGHGQHMSSSLIRCWFSDVSACCAVAYSEMILIPSAESLLNLFAYCLHEVPSPPLAPFYSCQLLRGYLSHSDFKLLLAEICNFDLSVNAFVLYT